MNKYHQGGEDLYTENCQTLMKQKTEVMEQYNMSKNWKNLYC